MGFRVVHTLVLAWIISLMPSVMFLKKLTSPLEPPNIKEILVDNDSEHHRVTKECQAHVNNGKDTFKICLSLCFPFLLTRNPHQSVCTKSQHHLLQMIPENIVKCFQYPELTVKCIRPSHSNILKINVGWA